MLNYTEKKDFSPVDFSTPSSAYSPVYSWIWNSPMTTETVEKEIDEMAEQGMRAFYIIPEPPEFRNGYMETKMSPPYLSEEFFTLVRHAMEYAAKKNMVTWLYDEGGWPSGSACGRVTEKYPEVRAKRLAVKNRRMRSGEVLKWEDEFISVICGDEISANEDIKVSEDTDIEIYYIETIKTRDPHLQCKKAVEEFIRSTYDEYKRYMGDLFGEKTFAMFTDEAIMYAPFYVDCINEFEEKYGRNFAKMVPALFKAWKGADGKRFKTEYIEFCCEKFCDIYVETLHSWCRENGILFTGHMNGDDVLSGYIYQSGNALYHLRHMDIPGVDVIWRQIYPGSKQNSFFPRIASSAAHQVGSNYAVSESFAVYGAGLTYDLMRYVCGYQFVRGINIINPMSVTSGREDFLSFQCRPHFVPQLPGAKHMSSFNEYLSRMMYLTSVGKIDAETALYMPIRDVWADNGEAEKKYYELGKRLEETQIYFDVIDDSYICESEIMSGCLGEAKYKAVFVPPNCWMKRESKKKLEAFAKSGGRVFTVGDSEIEYSENWTEAAEDEYSLVTCDSKHIRAMRRMYQNGYIYILFNESEKKESFTVNIDKKYRKLYRLNPLNGEIYVFEEREYLLPSGGELVILDTDAEFSCSEEVNCGNEISTARITGLKKTERCMFERGAWKVLSENSEMKNGEWEKDFSGTAVYTAEFDATAGCNIVIDLGYVYGSCELRLNGHSIGTCIVPPYTVNVNGSIVKEKNILEISVFNTGANAMSSADFSDYPPQVKGPYHEKTLEFERDSLISGLADKIKIFKSV